MTCAWSDTDHAVYRQLFDLRLQIPGIDRGRATHTKSTLRE